jgi:hypothetical protein
MQLLLRNEYLAAQNRILRAQIKGRLGVIRGRKKLRWLRSPTAWTESLGRIDGRCEAGYAASQPRSREGSSYTSESKYLTL